MKVLNLDGIFYTYINSLKIDADQNANFSLLKKEVVDVGPIKQHLLKISQVRQEKDYKKLYTNLYTSHIISSEWRGHNDAITDLEFIDDPISTITISKDKFLRVWNEKFELIGEINIFADETNINANKFIKREKVEWGFKVNEKKLLEKEVAEFVRILENIEINEETKIVKGSKIDLDFNNPDLYEIDEKEGLIPKREKPPAEEEDKNLNIPQYVIKNTTIVNESKEESDFQSNYEAIMLKNIANQIEFIIKNEPENEGIGELSNSLMNSLIESKAKLARLKKLRINDFNKLSSPNEIIDKKGEVKRESMFSFKKSQSSGTNLINVNLEEQKILKENLLAKEDKKPKKSLNLNLLKNKVFKRESDINIVKNTTMYSTGFKEKKIDIKKIKPEEKPLSKTTKSLFRNKFKNTFSDIKILFKGDKSTNIFNRANYCLNRNNLYAEKFAYKSFYNPREKEKEKEKEKQGFPKINTKYFNKRFNIVNKIHHNLNFEARKRTDDLIKTQYYFSNYKNCVKINPNYSDFSSNKSNMFNYKNMWNDIKLYTRDMISNEEKKRKTINFNKPYQKLYKSKSAFNIKSA